MAGIERRIQRLEGRLESQSETSETFLKLRAVLDELGRLKAGCAKHYRAGVLIEPENIPRQILGPRYTEGELLGLAAERAAVGGAFPLEEAALCHAVLLKLFGDAGKDFDAVIEWETV
jgi:hypothetical protein